MLICEYFKDFAIREKWGDAKILRKWQFIRPIAKSVSQFWLRPVTGPFIESKKFTCHQDVEDGPGVGGRDQKRKCATFKQRQNQQSRELWT